MRELQRPIGRVWRRLRFQRFLSALMWSWAAGLVVVAVVLAVEKLTSRTIPGPGWAPFVVAFDFAVLVAAAVAIFRGPSRVDAAVAIDRAFRLNERLSTALTLPPGLAETPAGQALLLDAVRHVAEIDVRSAFGLHVPRRAWVPLIPAAVSVAILFAPNVTQLRAQAKPADRVDRKLVEAQTKALGKKIASQRQEIEKTKFPEADKLLAQIEKVADDLAKAPPAKKDKALVEMNRLTDALKERQKQLGSPEQLSRQLAQLKAMSNQGPADQFAKEVAKGDFLKAANEVKKLQEKLKSGKLTDAEKKTLKDQLGEMSKNLQKLASLDQRKKQLEEAKKNGGLTPEQFKQEMAKLEDQARSLQKLAQMAQKLGEAQDALEKGDMKKAAQSLGTTEKQLAEMARNLQELEALDGALADLQEAKNGMAADGMNAIGESLDSMGMGRNRRGGQNGFQRGQGQGDRPEAPDKTSEYTTKVRPQIGKGKAVVDGTAPSNSPLKGQSVIDIQGEIAASAGNAADALTNQKVPRNIEKHVRGYFDQINKGK